MYKVNKRSIKNLPNQNVSIDYNEVPVFTGQNYLDRIDKLLNLTGKTYSHVIVYADREHFSNMEYLTGYDPRFEEALLILSKGMKPKIIVGDEGCSYATKIPFDIDIITFPTFSLPNQPKDSNITLEKILIESGIVPDSKIALIGWKLFDLNDYSEPLKKFDFPSFIIESIEAIVGVKNLHNETKMMMDGESGLRNNLDEKELILCEIAGTKSSRSVLRVIQNLKTGMSELEASSFLNIDGDPINVHPNINFGNNIFYALSSPSPHRKLKYGELVGVGMAYRRSLCHHVSRFVDDESDLSAEELRIMDLYFAALTTWYESIRIGVSGGSVYDAFFAVAGDPLDFGIALNLGHLIHTDEWTFSPFSKNSTSKLHSGMAVQCDFSTCFPENEIAIHAEDGIILADEELQQKIKEIAPSAFKRMLNRRDFMINELGIKLAPEILPTSDMPGVVFPYLRKTEVVLSML